MRRASPICGGDRVGANGTSPPPTSHAAMRELGASAERNRRAEDLRDGADATGSRSATPTSCCAWIDARRDRCGRAARRRCATTCQRLGCSDVALMPAATRRGADRDGRAGDGAADLAFAERADLGRRAGRDRRAGARCSRIRWSGRCAHPIGNACATRIVGATAELARCWSAGGGSGAGATLVARRACRSRAARASAPCRPRAACSSISCASRTSVAATTGSSRRPSGTSIPTGRSCAGSPAIAADDDARRSSTARVSPAVARPVRRVSRGDRRCMRWRWPKACARSSTNGASTARAACTRCASRSARSRRSSARRCASLRRGQARLARRWRASRDRRDAGTAWCMRCGDAVAIAGRGEACPKCGSYQLAGHRRRRMRVLEIEIRHRAATGV